MVQKSGEPHLGCTPTPVDNGIDLPTLTGDRRISEASTVGVVALQLPSGYSKTFLEGTVDGWNPAFTSWGNDSLSNYFEGFTAQVANSTTGQGNLFLSSNLQHPKHTL